MSGFYGDVIPIAEYRGKVYEPSNGTEGEMFWEAWCVKCKRDRVMNGTIQEHEAGPDDHCQTLNDSFIGGGTSDWIFGDDGWPKCTRFVSVDEPETVERDEFTIDMFGDAAAQAQPASATLGGGEV